MTVMSTTYREVLHKQLPWLPALLPKETREFTFQVLDLSTLGLVPDGHWIEMVPSSHRYVKRGSIKLISGDGKVIGEVGQEVTVEPRFRWSWRRFRFIDSGEMESCSRVFPETVEHALRRVSGSEKTRYILELQTTRSQELDAILHKLPKSAGDMASWLGQKSNEAGRKLSDFLQTA